MGFKKKHDELFVLFRLCLRGLATHSTSQQDRGSTEDRHQSVCTQALSPPLAQR